MKLIFFIIIGLVIITGCNNESDYFDIKSGEFKVSMLNEKGDTIYQFTDSIKITVNQQKSIRVILDGAIDEYYVSINEKYEGSLGNVKLNDETIVYGEKMYMKSMNFKMTVLAEEVKDYEGFLMIGDDVKEQKFYFKIVGFNNKLPVAGFDVTKIAMNSPYEVIIDATKSYDRDEYYGGEIIEYEYIIGDYYKLNTTEYSSIKHIFPTEGTYTISVRVKDNNDVWSTSVYQQVDI